MSFLLKTHEVVILLLVASLGLTSGFGGLQFESCTYRKWGREGTVKLLVVAGVHENNAGRCGDVSRSVTPLVVVLDWMVAKLNGQFNGGHSYIPEVTIGYDLFDNCHNADLTTDLLYSGSVAGQQNLQCSESSGNQTTYAAVLSMADIESTRVISQMTRPAPVLRPLPASPGLELEPNVIQTVVPFQQETGALVSFLLHQDWNFIVVVHTTDEYGRSTSSHFTDVAKQSGICVDLIAEPTKSAVQAIYDRMLLTINETIALVFFGDQNSAEDFVTISKTITRPSDSRIIWIFSSVIDKVPSIVSNDRLFSIQYPQYDFNDLYDYLENVSTNVVDAPIASIVAEYGNSYGTAVHTNQITHVVDALLSVAFTIKQANCTNGQECESKGLYDSIVTSTVDVNKHFSDSFIPRSYQNLNIIVQYDTTGFQKYDNLIVMDDSNVIGTFNKTVGYIPSYDIPLWSSACKEICENCRQQQTKRYSYLHGDVLILGLFSLRTYGDSPYSCGVYRGACTDTISVSAFMEYIVARRKTENILYGGIALDDCYNALNTTHLLAELFSKRKTITDSKTGVYIDFDNVILIVGALSSPVSIVVADFANSIGVPMVSYGASTPELDNRNRYPHFFRTVPSDTLQVRGMVGLLKELGVTHIGAIYIDDSYGKNGIRKLQEEAAANNVCIETPHAVTQTMSDDELLSVIDALYVQQVRVVVYFSIESIAVKLIRKMPGSDTNRAPLIFIASEAWGRNLEVIQGSLGKTSIGTVVFNIANLLDTNPAFKTYLQNLKISENIHNRWISKLFEDYNKCDLLTSFEKIHKIDGKDNICGPGMKDSLSSEDVETLFTDQRVVHIGHALHAAIEGYKQFCSGVNQRTCLANVRKDIAGYSRSIAGVRHGNKPLFDNDHNGNIGFTLYNIQLNETVNSYSVDYVQVGTYSTQGQLSFTKTPLFYNDVQKVIDIRDVYNTDCVNYESCAQVCLLPTTQAPSKTSSTTAAVIDEKDGESNAMLAIVIVFAVLLALLGVALVLVIVILLRRSSGKDSSKDLTMSHRNSIDNTYAVVSGDRGHYHVPHSPSHTRGSNSDDSHLSLHQQKPVSYADIRHLSYPDLRVNHVRQMSSPEIHQLSTLSTPRNKSKYSPASNRMFRPRSHQAESSLLKPNASPLVPKTPHSAPSASTLDKNFRHKAGSSPRFRYPSTEPETGYVYPTGQIAQSDPRVQPVRAETNSEDRYPDSHTFDNYITPKSDEPSEVKAEATITYLTAKDLVQDSSEEEEENDASAVEWAEDTGYQSANPSSVNSEPNNHNVLNKFAYDPNLKSPSDNEVSKINFPESTSSPKSMREIPDVLRHGRYEEEDNVFII